MLIARQRSVLSIKDCVVKNNYTVKYRQIECKAGNLFSSGDSLVKDNHIMRTVEDR